MGSRAGSKIGNKIWKKRAGIPLPAAAGRGPARQRASINAATERLCREMSVVRGRASYAGRKLLICLLAKKALCPNTVINTVADEVFVRTRLVAVDQVKSPGAPRGNRNAYKHGLYSAEAIARRRSLSALIRSVRRQCAS